MAIILIGSLSICFAKFATYFVKNAGGKNHKSVCNRSVWQVTCGQKWQKSIVLAKKAFWQKRFLWSKWQYRHLRSIKFKALSVRQN
jgi:hypothetical protein